MTDRLRELSERFLELPVVAACLARLRNHLPPTLFYHTYDHTLDVYHEALAFGVADGLGDRELELLAIAAVLHDMGYIDQPTANEPLAAAHAREMMTSDGSYTVEEIALVAQMILDTTLQTTPTGRMQVATTPLSGYLLDADVSNFGRQDFFEKGELQRRELGCEKATFLADTLTLLRSHAWQTPAAKAQRGPQKTVNLAALERLIAEGR